LRPISTLTIGDDVLAYNEATGEVDYYPILATIVHQDQVVQLLTIDGETIVTTPNHPFYTIAEEWIPAGQLQVGDLVRRADGRYGMVEAITFVYQPQPMYNLTVAAAHTYFVGDGQWLVHNVCQIHHALSKKIQDALDMHPTLSGTFNREDDLLKFVASSDEAHRGYQTWHRQYDRQVVEWLLRNPGATRADFLNYLIGVYSREDMARRFPDAVDKLRSALRGG
jgi:hypothetical protein